MPPESTWNNPYTPTPVPSYEQPPKATHGAVEREVYNLAPHPLSNPHRIARALRMRKALDTSNKVTSRHGYVQYKDKERNVDFSFLPLGNVVLFSGVEDGTEVLYINETPSTVRAAHAMVTILTSSEPLLESSVQHAVRRNSRLRTAGRAVFTETALLPLEVTPFVWGSGSVELGTAALGGVAIALFEFTASLAYTSEVFPRTFQRMVATMPNYLTRGSVVKIMNLPTYFEVDPGLANPARENVMVDLTTPTKLIENILRVSTNPAPTWDSIRENTQALSVAVRRAEFARTALQNKRILSGYDAKPAELETLEGETAKIKYIMNTIVHTVKHSLSEQIYQKNRMELIDAAIGLLGSADTAKTQASYFSELLVRTVSKLEPGDMEGMDQAKAIHAYLSKNLPLIQDNESAKTALAYLHKVYGTIIELPPNQEISL